MEKGIACLGCSYTWGEGLYFYSELEDLPFKERHGFDIQTMRSSLDAYRKKYRWPRLLANQEDSWEYTSDIGNGGANISHYNYCIHKPLVRGDIKYSDFKYFVWQITDVVRDAPGGYDFLSSLQDEELRPLHEREIKRLLHFANTVAKEWERNGVTVLVWNWQDDFKDNDDYHKLFKDRHVPINLDGTEHFCLSEIVGNGNERIDFNKTSSGEKGYITFKDDIGVYKNKPTRKKITIRDDFSELGFQKNDVHLNIIGNQVIADSISKKIKELKEQGKIKIQNKLI